ncbi:MAG: 50S ribosomal protein L25 [Actinomycetota bacterium]|nr:50S ribosomal protein L25 [Actinomycetota bacterium]MDA3019855.1 50S ribosomal protein L25 [Actinomycetota bacterium]
MSTTLVATSGRHSGSAAARRLRREEKIPAVIYGQGMEPISVVVERRDLRNALSGAAGSNTILEISLDGNIYPAVIKEMQRHPVRRTVAHVDFLRINMSEELTISVPVVLAGEAKAVLAEGGLVDASSDTIDIVTTPANMPSEITVDITNMQPGDVIRLGEIKLPAGTRALGNPELAIVTAIAGSKAEADPTPAAAAEDAVPAAGDDKSKS